jgi:hypothetical protein
MELSQKKRDEYRNKDLIDLIHKNWAAPGENLNESPVGQAKIKMYTQAANNSTNVIPDDGLFFVFFCLSFSCFHFHFFFINRFEQTY